MPGKTATPKRTTKAKATSAKPSGAAKAAGREAPSGRRQALVTGATSGIGHATAIGLAKAGLEVTLLARDARRGEAARKAILEAAPGAAVHVLEGDLASQASVRDAAAEFLARTPKLHVLVHCAGVFLPTREVTEDGVEKTLATNYVGGYLLTELLLPALRRGAPARIVTVASRYGRTRIDFDDLQVARRKFSYLKAVPASKLAQVLWTQELAERLQGTGITANAVHPGLVAKTKLLDETRGFFRWMTNRMGGTPEQGADTVVWLATSAEANGETGGLWAKRKRIATPGQGSDPEARKRLREETETLVAR
ncbi:MAG TPA: SDR family NAD(P)-dependent oxidoreductase [Candidatus Thermoplasmatota archaeon]|nr:SDR family NAD(P)-dependent oxidoreductase [Candidatus Thermoplasmatota archaeon]